MNRMRTHSLTGVQTWQQVGWRGHTGAFYQIGEDPSKNERGGFAPVWELIENEPPEIDESK